MIAPDWSLGVLNCLGVTLVVSWAFRSRVGLV